MILHTVQRCRIKTERIYVSRHDQLILGLWYTKLWWKYFYQFPRSKRSVCSTLIDRSQSTDMYEHSTTAFTTLREYAKYDLRFSRRSVRRWPSSELQRRVDWYEFTDVSEVRTASMIRAISHLSISDFTFRTWNISRGGTYWLFTGIHKISYTFHACYIRILVTNDCYLRQVTCGTTVCILRCWIQWKKLLRASSCNEGTMWVTFSRILRTN
jgi:hypothetical protein